MVNQEEVNKKAQSNKIKLQIDAINVGHGDCIFLQWDNGMDVRPWRCVIDAGSNPDILLSFLKNLKIKEIDLVIVSHFDTDHIQGFQKISEHIKVKKYWSPYTPAFQKHLWLFGERGKLAINRARELEREMNNAGVLLEAPFEGHRISPSVGLNISVISPPYRIYERLLTQENIRDLLQEYPTPFEWLFSTTQEPSKDQEGAPSSLMGFYKRTLGYVIQRDIEQEEPELAEDGGRVRDKSTPDKQVWLKESSLEPEFFGNPLLNDSSIALRFEVWTGTRWLKMLFPGDLENWTYLIAKRPSDLFVDLYKAAHHGGRLYVGRSKAFDEILQTIRPTITIFSANGNYGLPRTEMRNAASRWSTALFCTQNKSCEHFTIGGSSPPSDCCFNFYKCRPINNEGIRIIVSDGNITVSPPACQRSVFTTPYPVIELKEHLIPDSRVLTHLTEAEIVKHTKWVAKQLRKIHTERILSKVGYISPLVSVQDIYQIANYSNRPLTEDQIRQIFEYGNSKGQFLAFRQSPKYGEVGDWNFAYLKPTKDDLEHLWEILYSKKVLVFSLEDKLPKGTKTILLKLHKDILCEWLENVSGLPSEVIDTYCWGMFIEEIINHFSGYYLIKSVGSEDEKHEWVLLVNKESDILSLWLSIYHAKRYLFNLDEIPGNDSDKLLNFLKNKFYIPWAEKTKIKNDNGTISISAEGNSLSLRLNNEKTKAILTINNEVKDEFIANIENGKSNIYKIINDWYELRDFLEPLLKGKGDWQLCTSKAYRTYIPRHSSNSKTEIDFYLFQEIISDGKFDEKKFEKIW